MIIQLTQKILWLVLKPTLGFFVKYEVQGKENIKNIKEPIIIAMNHKSAADAFLFGTILPFDSNLWPMKFFVSTQGFNTSILSFLNYLKITNLFYFIFGHFNVVEGAGLKANLKKAIEFLKESKKGSVFIFIEGKRVFEKNKFAKAKKGVAALSIMSEKKVLPISIKNSEGINLFNFWKKTIVFNIGESFLIENRHGDAENKYTKETEDVMNKIKKLYFK